MGYSNSQRPIKCRPRLLSEGDERIKTLYDRSRNAPVAGHIPSQVISAAAGTDRAEQPPRTSLLLVRLFCRRRAVHDRGRRRGLLSLSRRYAPAACVRARLENKAARMGRAIIGGQFLRTPLCGRQHGKRNEG